MIFETLKDDATILISRALLGKTIGYFGIDGNGQHGRDVWAHYSKVEDVVVFIKGISTDEADLDVDLMVFLENYSAKTHGHILTDQNFMMSLNEHLKNADIDPVCVSWASLELQGDNCVTLKLDIHELLQW